MKTIRWHKTGDVLHIETDGCIVNVTVGLSDHLGHAVTAVEVIADRYAGESWHLPDHTTHDGAPLRGMNVRVMRDTIEGE